MSLQDDGFRFVWRSPNWVWVHPAELTDLDRIDGTDMTDDEFDRTVTNIDKCSIAIASGL